MGEVTDTLFNRMTSSLSSFFDLAVKDCNKRHVTNEVRASHMGDHQSSVAAQNIFNVAALEILLVSKLQMERTVALGSVYFWRLQPRSGPRDLKKTQL